MSICLAGNKAMTSWNLINFSNTLVWLHLSDEVHPAIQISNISSLRFNYSMRAERVIAIFTRECHCIPYHSLDSALFNLLTNLLKQSQFHGNEISKYNPKPFQMPCIWSYNLDFWKSTPRLNNAHIYSFLRFN